MVKTKFFANVRDQGSKTPGDCGSPFDQQPEWYDEEKMDRAAKVFHEYSAAVLMSHLLGTVIMSQVESLMDVLLKTGEQATPLSAEKRAVMTTHYVRTWYQGRVQDTGDQGRKNVKLVRQMHARVAKKLNSECPKDDGTYWLSQYDMTLTQFAFVGALVVNPKKLGFYGTNEDIEAILYYWRYIGYLLGIEDQYNLGAGTYEEVRDICQDIVDEVVKPTLSNPQPLFSRTLQYAFIGFAKVGTGIILESVYNFSCDVIDYQAIRKSLNLRQWFSYWLLVIVTYFMRYPGFRAKSNYKHHLDSGKKMEALIESYKKREKSDTSTSTENSETSPKYSGYFIVKVWNYFLQIGSILFDKLRKEHEM